jgi:hypothetical protein
MPPGHRVLDDVGADAQSFVPFLIRRVSGRAPRWPLLGSDAIEYDARDGEGALRYVPSVYPHVSESIAHFQSGAGRYRHTVTLMIRCNRRGEVYVHVYERKVVLVPGGEVKLTFVATDAGTFPIHLHDPDGSMPPRDARG